MAESDFERIDMDPVTEEVRFHEKPDYAQAVFHNIAETYFTDAHIVCKYSITAALEATQNDFIGLYKVGWLSSSEPICFQPSPMPSMYQPGQEVTNQVVFQAHYLPKDDGEFYQFCYVSGTKRVRGASTPFQFKKPVTDDYVEVEEDDLMMVKTRTAALMEDLNTALVERANDEKKIKLLESERDGLLTKLVAETKASTVSRKETEALRSQLGTAQERCGQLEKEYDSHANILESMRDKLDTLSKEKLSIEKKMEEKDDYIASLQEKIKALISEKDALTGKNKTLEQEKELFKNHFTSTESNVQKYKKTIDEQNEKLTEQVESTRLLTEEVQRLRDQVDENQTKLEEANHVKSASQARIIELSEGLRHSEDKFSASEAMVAMMKSETIAQTQVISKMSTDLEEAKTQAFNLQTRYTQLEKTHKTEKTKWLDEKAELQSLMKSHEKELSVLSQKVEDLSEKARAAEGRAEEEEGSLYALQTAQSHLRERYSKMKAEYAEMKKENDALQKRVSHHQQMESDLRRDNTDLKERLTMGAEEYKTKYLEARKLESEIRKLSKQLKRSVTVPKGPSAEAGVETEVALGASSATQTPTRSLSVSSTSSRESRTTTADVGTVSRVATSDVGTLTRLQMTDAGTSTTKWPGLAVAMPATPPTPISPPASLTPPKQTPPPEHEKIVEELTTEVTLRKAKQQKYKQLYHDEKEKIAVLQKYYYGEVERKDEEMAEVRRQHEDKLRALEERIEAQTQTIERQRAHIEQLSAKEQQTHADASSVQVDAGASGADAAAAMDTESLGEEEEEEENAAPVLEMPLTPLPAPIQPTVLPSAKVAAVKCLNDRGRQEGLNMFLEDDDNSSDESDEGPPPLEPTDPEEERFHDADGEPQKLCPACNMTFPADFPQHVFEAHVDGHYGPVCPMCHEQFDVTTDQGLFEAHVQAHFGGE